MKRLQFVLFSVLMIGMVGCRSSKEVVERPTKKDREWLEELMQFNEPYQTLESKLDFKVKAREGVSAGMRGSIKMERDKGVILSLQPFAGIEVARCLIRPDSVWVVSRLHSSYAVMPLQQLERLDAFHLFQSIFMHQVFIPGESKPRSKDLDAFVWKKSKDYRLLELMQKEVLWQFWMDEDDRYNRMEVRESGQESATVRVNYASFKELGSFEYPHQLNLSVKGMDREIVVDFNLIRPQLNEVLHLDFSISPKYTLVTMEELIGKFQNML